MDQRKTEHRSRDERGRTAERFVVDCVRAAIGNRRGRFDWVDADLEWDRVVALATKHGVSSLIVSAIETHSVQNVPDSHLQTLENRTKYVSQRNLRLFQEVATLSAAFQNEGISAIPYRGPVAGEVIFGSVGRREFGDLDFLVSRESIPDLRSVLLERGYDHQYVLETTGDLTENQRWAYARFSRDYAFVHRTEPFEVELHWRVVSRRFPSTIDLGTVWERRSTLPVAGTDVPVLGHEDRLLMLCVHGTRHRWERLMWLCDVCAYINTQSFDWDTVLERARRHSRERMLYLGLAVADELLGVGLPETVRRAIDRDPVIDSLTSHVRNRLFDEATYWHLDTKRYQARTLDRRRDRVAFWIKGAIEPDRGEIELLSLPRPLVPLYSLVRCFRIGRATLNRLLTPTKCGEKRNE
ncbi:hypothetical protein EA462_12735 [Natrarchaeobius halalkaliphilus]|uniref:Nucleotidyltransferase family protein n=1 Tax=Natrarchaeobius halalkaliphilus TaxID=1679091 RepID=A0A3N6P264_9EURY|nr:nucleotidyltransferase family protein [Natrarchaeobius halalkaliphilus]RQG89225.1 hypothetical protein EA462_12735 [Natrarchaeobius halalkaliphilus]